MTADWFGVTLLFLGLALMVAEGLSPSFGLIGVGGFAAFVLGGLYLGGSGAPGFPMSWPVLISFSIAGLAILAGVIFIASRVRRRHKIVTGKEQLIGASGRVTSVDGDTIYAEVNGERWKLLSETGLTVGDRIQVRKVQGLTLMVEPFDAARRTRSTN